MVIDKKLVFINRIRDIGSINIRISISRKIELLFYWYCYDGYRELCVAVWSMKRCARNKWDMAKSSSMILLRFA